MRTTITCAAMAAIALSAGLAFAEAGSPSEPKPTHHATATTKKTSAEAAAKKAADETKAQAALMAEGLQRETDHDYEAAIRTFREVLARNPTHYGATWQLAKSLDAAGQGDKATPVWEKMLVLTRAAHDADSEAKVLNRLGRPAAAPQGQ